jgi:hypothetical protein
MLRLLALPLALLLPLLPASPWQEPDAPSAPEEPRWEDAVARVYALISGPAGQARDWDAFRAMFVEGGNLMVSAPTPAGGSRLIVLTPDEYVQRSGARVEAAGFFERETGRRFERYGNVVHVWSAYEGRGAFDGREEVLVGINSFQLVRVAEGWKVANLLWEQERPGNPVPADLRAPAED